MGGWGGGGGGEVSSGDRRSGRRGVRGGGCYTIGPGGGKLSSWVRGIVLVQFRSVRELAVNSHLTTWSGGVL